jgi:hypothetical protein
MVQLADFVSFIFGVLFIVRLGGMSKRVIYHPFSLDVLIGFLVGVSGLGCFLYAVWIVGMFLQPEQDGEFVELIVANVTMSSVMLVSLMVLCWIYALRAVQGFESAMKPRLRRLEVLLKASAIDWRNKKPHVPL